MSLLNDFKKFLFRGNVVDLAVAVVIGAAFGAVIKALVADLLTPIIALIFGEPDFGALSFTINSSHFFYGDFLNNVITFVSVAAAVFFFVVTPVNHLIAHRGGGPRHEGVSGMHQRDPREGATMPRVHRATRERLGLRFIARLRQGARERRVAEAKNGLAVGDDEPLDRQLQQVAHARGETGAIDASIVEPALRAYPNAVVGSDEAVAGDQ